jgi:hypothetical protein
VTRERVAGMMIAPAMPVNPRIRISCIVDLDSPASTDPRAKRRRPNMRERLRPTLSPMEPIVRSRAAKMRI